MFALFTAAGIDWLINSRRTNSSLLLGLLLQLVGAPLQIVLTGLHRQSAGSEGAVCKLREAAGLAVQKLAGGERHRNGGGEARGWVGDGLW